RVHIRLGDIRGWLPFDIRVGEITLSDEEGVWLTAEDAAVRWRGLPLLEGRIHGSAVTVGQVTWHRIPTEEDPDLPDLPELPDRWPSVTVERIEAREVVLEEAVMGQRAVFTVEGHVAPPPDRHGVGVDLSLTRLDGPQERVTVLLGLLGEPGELSYEVKIPQAGPGSLLLHLARLPADTEASFRLSGGGALPHLDSVVSLHAAEVGEAEFDVALGLPYPITFGVDGEVTLFPDRLPGGVHHLTEEPSAVTVQGAFKPRESLRLDKIAVEGQPARLAASGRLDLVDHTAAADIDFESEDIAVFGAVAGIPLGGGLSGAGHVEGPLLQPEGWLEVAGTDLLVDELQADSLETRAEAASLSEIEGDFPGLDANLRGNVTGLRSADRADFEPLDLEWDGHATAETPERIDIARLGLNGGGVQADLSGHFAPEDLGGAVEANLIVDEVARLPLPFLPPELGGYVELQVSGEGSGQARTANANIEGHLANAQGLPEPAPALVGDRLDLRVDAALDESGEVTLREAMAEGTGVTATAEGRLGLDGRDFGLTWEARLPEMAALSAFAGQDLAGELDLTGSAEGTFDVFQATIEGDGRNLALDEFSFASGRVELALEQLPATPRGRAAVRLGEGGEAYEAEGRLAMTASDISVEDVLITAPGARITGHGRYRFEPQLASGQLDGAVEDLEPVTALVGEPMTGSVELALLLDDAGDRQNAEIDLTAASIGSRFADLENLMLEASLNDIRGTLAGSLEARVDGLTTEEFVLDAGVVEAEGEAEALRFAVETDGAVADEPFHLDGGGEAALDLPQFNVTLASLDAAYVGIPVVNQTPITATRTETGWEIPRAELEVGDGARFALQGAMEPDQLQGQVEFDRIDLAILERFLPTHPVGEAQGTVTLAGAPDAPELTAELDVAQLRVDHPMGQELDAGVLKANARLAEGRLRAQARFDGPLESNAGVAADLPLAFSLDPFAFEAPTDAPIQASVTAQTPLEIIGAALLLDDQLVSGNLEADLAVSGTLDAPAVSGHAAIPDGRYEHWEHGVVLHEIDARFVAQDQHLVLERATMTDGGAGEVALEGRLDLDPDRDFPFQASTRFRNAQLVRQDNFRGTVNGTLEARGSSEGALVNGVLTCAPIHLSIPDRLPASAGAQLEVTEINRPGAPAEEGEETGAEEEEAPATSSPAYDARLDVQLDFPGRVYLRGRGLDSEWQGRLRVRGPITDPMVIGNLNVLRGDFSFMERRFNMAESTIVFDGSTPVSPMLDITAVSDARDLTARLRVTGPADSPDIALESDPSLPQDEILARVLFGRDLANINPVQALRLAHAANTLAGGGARAFELMGRTRQMLGMDQLDVRGVGEDDPTVAMGRYIGDDIYVEVEKGLMDDSGRLHVEVELTPRFSLDSEVGADAEGSMGFNWRYDY
ncbi:MAG: translocation/assembly module TamB domain-containing protein, partial [Candidatus Hydrogenedentota bacterium]